LNLQLLHGSVGMHFRRGRSLYYYYRTFSQEYCGKSILVFHIWQTYDEISSVFFCINVYRMY